MSTSELLWTIREERRRQAAAAARERLSRTSVRTSGTLVGWVRRRLRALRDGLGPRPGWRLETR